MMNGAMLENYTVSEILKSYIHNGEDCPMYFYRDKGGKEIDPIIERNMTLYPVEIKRTASPSLNDARHLEILKSDDRLKLGMGAIVCLRPEPIPLSKNVVSIPVSHI